MAFQLLVLFVTLVSLYHATSAQSLDDNDAAVVILGGGPAGIHAAAALIEKGIEDIIILEPTDRLRGYLATVEFDGKKFAPGSLWGYSPIYNRLNEDGINYKTSDYDSYIVLNEEGEDVTEEADERYEVLAKAKQLSDKIANAIHNDELPDVSQKASLGAGGWIANSDVDNAIEWYEYDFSEGRSTRESSTVGPWRQRRYEVFGEDEYLIADPEVTLGDPLLGDAEAMLQDGHVRYGQFGVSVTYYDDGVTVVTEDGTEYTAEYVIVANTVGVLQNGAVTFDPPLPHWKTLAICRGQMGTIDPIFMKFDTKFWGDEEFILHAGERHGEFPVFMNMEAEGLYPEGTNILISFASGNDAYAKEYKNDTEIIEKAVEILSKMYDDVPEPTDFYMSRFATDPYLYGNFATFPIGDFPKEAIYHLEARIGRVYFALEDAHDINIGIPFGSVQTGKRAAAAVAECIEGNCAEAYEPDDYTYPPCEGGPPGPPPRNPLKMRKNRYQ